MHGVFGAAQSGGGCWEDGFFDAFYGGGGSWVLTSRCHSIDRLYLDGLLDMYGREWTIIIQDMDRGRPFTLDGLNAASVPVQQMASVIKEVPQEKTDIAFKRQGTRDSNLHPYLPRRKSTSSLAVHLGWNVPHTKAPGLSAPKTATSILLEDVYIAPPHRSAHCPMQILNVR